MQLSMDRVCDMELCELCGQRDRIRSSVLTIPSTRFLAHPDLHLGPCGVFIGFTHAMALEGFARRARQTFFPDSKSLRLTRRAFPDLLRLVGPGSAVIAKRLPAHAQPDFTGLPPVSCMRKAYSAWAKLERAIVCVSLRSKWVWMCTVVTVRSDACLWLWCGTVGIWPVCV
jgi:hypothetical protein